MMNNWNLNMPPYRYKMLLLLEKSKNDLLIWSISLSLLPDKAEFKFCKLYKPLVFKEASTRLEPLVGIWYIYVRIEIL